MPLFTVVILSDSDFIILLSYIIVHKVLSLTTMWQNSGDHYKKSQVVIKDVLESQLFLICHEASESS